MRRPPLTMTSMDPPTRHYVLSGCAAAELLTLETRRYCRLRQRCRRLGAGHRLHAVPRYHRLLILRGAGGDIRRAGHRPCNISSAALNAFADAHHDDHASSRTPRQAAPVLQMTNHAHRSNSRRYRSAFGQNGDPGVLAMQLLAGKHIRLDPHQDRPHRCAGRSHLIGKRGQAQRHTFAPIAFCLPVLAMIALV
jgi:hypothetical protein